MKQKDKNRFECKLKLDKAIEEKQLSKENFEWIIKHILKNNLYLVKHYPLIKNSVKSILNECNELLEMDFFISDKVLIIWLARSLNKVLKDNGNFVFEIGIYLKEKGGYNPSSFRLWENSDYHDKFDMLGYGRIIDSRDDCFKQYLPQYKSDSRVYNGYGDWESEYSNIDEEVDKGLKLTTLTKEEKENIDEFRFCNISEDELKNIIVEKIENNDIGKILSAISYFEDEDIFENTSWNFNYHVSNHVYSLLKMNGFDYNVNDKYFVVKNERYLYYGDGSNFRMLNVSSFNENELMTLIDVPLWVKYMNSHDINDFEKDWYIDDEYFKDNTDYTGFNGFLKYNFSNEEIGINTIIDRIENNRSSLKESLEKLRMLDEKYHKDEDYHEYKICYSVPYDEIKIYDKYEYNKDDKIVLGDLNCHINRFIDRMYLRDCIMKHIGSNKDNW